MKNLIFFQTPKGKQTFFNLVVSFAVFLSLCFAYTFFVGVWHPSGLVAKLQLPTRRISYFFAYLSTQANLIVLFAVWIEVLRHRFRLPAWFIFYVRLMATTYIFFITSFFWFSFVAGYKIGEEYSAWTWPSTIYYHVVSPVVMAFIFFATAGRKYSFIWSKPGVIMLWTSCNYLWIYWLFIMVRGYFGHNSSWPAGTAFPYLFINYFRAHLTEVAGTMLVTTAALVAWHVVIVMANNFMFLANQNARFHGYLRWLKYNLAWQRTAPLSNQTKLGLWGASLVSVIACLFIGIMWTLYAVHINIFAFYERQSWSLSQTLIAYSVVIFVCVCVVIATATTMLGKQHQNLWLLHGCVWSLVTMAFFLWFSGIGSLLAWGLASWILLHEDYQVAVNRQQVFQYVCHFKHHDRAWCCEPVSTCGRCRSRLTSEQVVR